ncbi:MAG: hypothetical protein WBD47_22350 [Phormidesmis sp.]
MSQQLTLEISDEVYKSLEQQATAVGVTIPQWIVTVLSTQGNSASSALSPEHQEQARRQFRRHAGAVSLGHATGAESQEIDTDLAKAYADEY